MIDVYVANIISNIILAVVIILAMVSHKIQLYAYADSLLLVCISQRLLMCYLSLLNCVASVLLILVYLLNRNLGKLLSQIVEDDLRSNPSIRSFQSSDLQEVIETVDLNDED